MTDMSLERIDYSADDRRWIRDHSGFRNTIGVTLDPALFGALRFPGGVVPSGTVLARTDAGLWGPYDPAATDGRATAERGRVGHLLEGRTLRPGRRVSTALLDAGGVEERLLPTSPIGGAVGILDAAIREVLKSIRYA
ncbi:hypothetical protein [Kineococcus aurantiacus]|uniref:Uncharacterized protein n=1 Tax=Kineococcus aurantiacus TaxID=37633 RepID=A0A7Y9DI33_9ACTN|nr:hypothetical protein [Kineococcus aurantiacus]NYD20950.1 hypothetical protein [Kineococcus aurantiacus]